MLSTSKVGRDAREFSHSHTATSTGPIFAKLIDGRFILFIGLTVKNT